MEHVLEFEVERLDRGLLRFLTVDTRGQKINLAVVKGMVMLSADNPFTVDLRGPLGEVQEILTSCKRDADI